MGLNSRTRILRWGPSALCGVLLVASLVSAVASAAQAQPVDTSRWDAYIDFAYVYVSADSKALHDRLEQYGVEAGMTLDEYVLLRSDERRRDRQAFDDRERRRLAIGLLLQYLSARDSTALDRAVDSISTFAEDKGRHENRYWYHYIMAHRALEKGNSPDFTRQILDLWLGVVVPLESPYETLHALSLSQSANSGFVSALPYVFENVARMILIRSQKMGIYHDLDPLAGILRMLASERVGHHPDVIPVSASSKDYLERIIARLDGPESDGGSLSFTLLLFEAGKFHDQARSLLASEGLSPATIEAISATSGAYQTALDEAETLQGRAAVYTRVLRQLGEVWSAKQREGVDPYVETLFTIEGAMETYSNLYSAGRDGGWKALGYRSTGFESYVGSMRKLWEEIQEASLNGADYYLTRSVEDKPRAGDHLRSAARIYSRYSSHFEEFANQEAVDYVPDSAYFAAYESAKGYADALLVYSQTSPTVAEIDLAVERYQTALRTFPFDRRVWPALAGALERQGRSNQYLSVARPIADAAARSRHVSAWIMDRQPGAQQIEILRRAMSDELAVMYLGFAEEDDVDELERSMSELRQRRTDLESQLLILGAGAGRSRTAPPASPAGVGGSERPSVLERAARAREVAETKLLLEKLEKQLAARNRALPLFKATLETDELIQELRSQRDHPVHTLLRRLYYEVRPGIRDAAEVNS